MAGKTREKLTAIQIFVKEDARLFCIIFILLLAGCSFWSDVICIYTTSIHSLSTILPWWDYSALIFLLLRQWLSGAATYVVLYAYNWLYVLFLPGCLAASNTNNLTKQIRKKHRGKEGEKGGGAGGGEQEEVLGMPQEISIDIRICVRLCVP